MTELTPKPQQDANEGASAGRKQPASPQCHYFAQETIRTPTEQWVFAKRFSEECALRSPIVPVRILALALLVLCMTQRGEALPWDASFAQGGSSMAKGNLKALSVNGSYGYREQWIFDEGYFSNRGNNNAALYAMDDAEGNQLTSSPKTSGYLLEVHGGKRTYEAAADRNAELLRLPWD